MFGKFKKKLSHNLQSALGEKVNKKVVVFESDDWGGIRMPSASVYDALVKKNPLLKQDRFSRFDSLSSADDLTALFETLERYKDAKGNHPIFTFNVTTANPDFDQILYSNYERFVTEPFDQTISSQRPGALQLWRQGMEQGLFYPQYHGREHIHQQRWLESLRNGDGNVLDAFARRTYGFEPKYGRPEYFLAAYDYASPADEAYWKESISEGLSMFQNFFGFKPATFIPPCYISPSAMIDHLNCHGVYALQGKIFEFLPESDSNGQRSYRKKLRHAGLNRKTGQVNLVRNCFFEPSSGRGTQWLADCLSRIEIAFRWHKPAVIDTHRVNYIGGIVAPNRRDNLLLLDVLLKEILKRWKDVEFMTSAQLAELYKGSDEQ